MTGFWPFDKVWCSLSNPGLKSLFLAVADDRVAYVAYEAKQRTHVDKVAALTAGITAAKVSRNPGQILTHARTPNPQPSQRKHEKLA